MATTIAKKDEPVNVDEQFLRDYIARGGKAQLIASEEQIDKENVDEFLRQRVADEKTQTVKTKLQKRAEKADAASDERIEREQKAEEQKRAAAQEEERKRQEEERLTQSQRFRKAASGAATNFGNSVQPALDRIASLHTVGGIGLLLVVLGILIFAVVQVNSAGDTRLKLLWAMLNGNATLTGRAQEAGIGGVGSAVNNGGGNPIAGVGSAVPLASSNGSFRSLPPLLGV